MTKEPKDPENIQLPERDHVFESFVENVIVEAADLQMEQVPTLSTDAVSNDVPINTKKLDLLSKEELERIAQDQKNRQDSDTHHWRRNTLVGLGLVAGGWVGFIGYVIHVHMDRLSLSDAVLIAIFTTTTATILGSFAIAAKWLFPEN